MMKHKTSEQIRNRLAELYAKTIGDTDFKDNDVKKYKDFLNKKWVALPDNYEEKS